MLFSYSIVVYFFLRIVVLIMLGFFSLVGIDHMVARAAEVRNCGD
jgi:hypothetical protein